MNGSVLNATLKKSLVTTITPNKEKRVVIVNTGGLFVATRIKSNGRSCNMPLHIKVRSTANGRGVYLDRGQ